MPETIAMALIDNPWAAWDCAEAFAVFVWSMTATEERAPNVALTWIWNAPLTLFCLKPCAMARPSSPVVVWKLVRPLEKTALGPEPGVEKITTAPAIGL